MSMDWRPLCIDQKNLQTMFSYTHTRGHARTHARTHVRTRRPAPQDGFSGRAAKVAAFVRQGPAGRSCGMEHSGGRGGETGQTRRQRTSPPRRTADPRAGRHVGGAGWSACADRGRRRRRWRRRRRGVRMRDADHGQGSHVLWSVRSQMVQGLLLSLNDSPHLRPLLPSNFRLNQK